MKTRSEQQVKEFSKKIGNAKVDVKVNGHFNGFGMIEKIKKFVQRIVIWAVMMFIGMVSLVLMSAIIIGMLATN